MIAVISSLIYSNFFAATPFQTQWTIGPVVVSSFGVLVTLDLLFAFHLAERWIRLFGLPEKPLLWSAVAAAVVGLIGSHLFSVVFYFPDNRTDWSAILDARTGMSSFGGLVGGGLAAIIAFRYAKFSVLSGLDMFAYGFVGGYVFGRAGCFSIHDHPGNETSFFLGANIDGVTRHDLGFYEMWLMLGLLISIHVIARRGLPQPGTVLCFFFGVYAPVRFCLDFLRADDLRYAGLTPAQWAAIPMFLIAVGLLIRRQTTRNSRDPKAQT